MSEGEPLETTPKGLFEVSFDPPAAGVTEATVTRMEETYYVFDCEKGTSMTAAAGTSATEANAEADIRLALESQLTFDLAAAKERKLQELADACRAEYTATLETSFGAPFHATEECILDVRMLVDMLAPAEVYPGYKCADDVWRDLTREQFELALQEGAARKSAAFAKRKTLTDQVEAATTQAELDAISWQS